MYKTLRTKTTFNYWTQRWSAINADDAMSHKQIYPLRYALEAVHMVPHGTILEAGCGAGRLLRYFFNSGYNIRGMDYIEVAVAKLKEVDSTLPVELGDITKTQYNDKEFDCILSFGLYHNLHGPALQQALNETYRITKDNGILCASFRADNFCNRINDYLADRRNGKKGTKFHKLNLTKDEFKLILENSGFFVERIEYVENMSLLYKFPIFRASKDAKMHEEQDRNLGYRLNKVGACIQTCLMKFFPKHFCNIHVAFARRKEYD